MEQTPSKSGYSKRISLSAMEISEAISTYVTKEDPNAIPEGWGIKTVNIDASSPWHMSIVIGKDIRPGKPPVNIPTPEKTTVPLGISIGKGELSQKGEGWDRSPLDPNSVIWMGLMVRVRFSTGQGFGTVISPPNRVNQVWVKPLGESLARTLVPLSRIQLVSGELWDRVQKSQEGKVTEVLEPLSHTGRDWFSNKLIDWKGEDWAKGHTVKVHSRYFTTMGSPDAYDEIRLIPMHGDTICESSVRTLQLVSKEHWEEELAKLSGHKAGGTNE